MIFVCTGTQVYQFNRLLEKIDELIHEGKITDEVFAQTGASTYIPKYYSFKPFLSSDEFKKYQAEASLIISHGGTGALIGASKLGKNIIAVPRLAKYGEHTDDHQLQIVEVLESEGYVRTVYDMSLLGKVIEDALSNPIRKVYARESNILPFIERYIDGKKGSQKSMKSYVLKYQIIRLLISIIPSASDRTRILKKIHFFKAMGNNVHFQPRHLPADPKFIKIHNNVSVASNVWFITHDIMQNVFNNIDQNHHDYKSHLGCIEIMDNVFIGSNVTILPNVRIGPNAIVAAGSIVTKDVPKGAIVAGNPAKVIGDFNTIMEKRKAESRLITIKSRLLRVDPEWKAFYKQRDHS